ncbi:alkene reductase [Mucilaginibacter sp. E4BP6]|uniref:alkene reductase n=1 Tax=Mucilaginibacter sp. E4BP6 TaxID=2723089 RepID=UPI0015CB9E1F|nr:alkene reductase [Mucilaginibacter sp. E4BP6]NYE68169.1 N-ethylmaleimide reductase [Mucilaginibacter sp. E4BP6]
MKNQINQTAPYGHYKLFSPVTLGPYTLNHRVALAPMTRLRSDAKDAPSDMMVKFYEQRSSQGGLLIAEGTAVSITGRSYYGAPGIYADEQIPAWQKLTDAVHAKGGRIFVQLFHGGRQSHVDMTGGVAPVAPSEVPFEGVSFTANGWVASSMHRALELDEIPAIIEDFLKGAERALAAGVDGVELHGANGYLPDQFLQDGTNKRTDGYGGSIENRARLMLELTKALISVWGADRVGVRISPSGEWGGIADSNPEATFGYLATELDKLGIAYIHVIEPRIKGDSTLHEDQAPVASATIRKSFKGTIISAGGFDREQAEAIINRGDADIVAFGRFFSSNPDLPERLKYDYPLTPYVRDTFWGGDETQYNDFPTYNEHPETANQII